MKAVVAWRHTPFPPGSTNDLLDEARADLVLMDTWVASALLPYIESQVWEPAAPDVLDELARWEADLLELQLGNADDSRTASSYLAYAGLLRTVYAAFLKQAPG